MKRTRCGARLKQPDQTSTSQEDFIAQLVGALRHHHDVLVLDPSTFHSKDETADVSQRNAVRSLLLILLSASTASRPSVSDETHPPYVLRGLGVLDYTTTTNVCGESESVDAVTFHVVPLYIQAAPWVPHLPPRMQSLVCDRLCFASLGTCDFGQADVGPVPEGYCTRRATVLIHGLPECCVDAVSGLFPLFHLPLTSEAAQGMESTEARWELRCACDVQPGMRDAAMHAHVKRLAPLHEEKLSAAMESVWSPTKSASRAMWVVVSYPDGLPHIPARIRQSAASDCLPRQVRRTAAHNGVSDAEAALDDGIDCAVPPLFLLSANFLCQYLHLHVGWQQIAQQHRKASLNAVQSLSAFMEACSLRNCDGAPVTVGVVCRPPATTTEPSFTLTKASLL